MFFKSYLKREDNSTEVRAPLMKFSIDFPIKLTAGFHFCKVLSPAVSDATINLKSTDGDEVFDNKSTYSRAGIYQNRISKMISKSNLVVFYFMKTRYLISMAVRV